MIDLHFTLIQRQLPKFIYEDIEEFVKNSNACHRQSKELIDLITAKFALDPEYIRITPGSDQSILQLLTLFGHSTHIFPPTYVCYSDAEKIHGILLAHNSVVDGQYNISIDSIPDASLIFLANPNNPFGTTKREDVLSLVKNNPNAYVVVDEAYADFYDAESVVDDVKEFRNLIVLRTFSKGYALAGFRIGFMLAAPEVIEKITLESTWFDSSYASTGAAISALKHEEYFKELREEIILERSRTEEALSSSGLNTIPSQANLVCIKFASDTESDEFVDYMKSNDVFIIKGGAESNYGLDDTYVRIGIGTPEQMEYVRGLIKNYVS